MRDGKKKKAEEIVFDGDSNERRDLNNCGFEVCDLDLVSEVRFGANLSGPRNRRSGRWR